MEDKEQWVPIEDFPGYAVSNHGRVMNTYTELIKIATANQQGIPSVLLMKHGTQHRRAVPLLVASYFVPKHRANFDTPINLDGNRFNNHWKNLQWRPRWFAMAYHHQFGQPVPFGFKAKVYCVDTKKEFDSVFDAAKEYGLLVKEIIMSTHTQTPVFPTWQTFGMVENQP